MRFAITGGDRGLLVFEALLKAGWEPLKLFTAPLDNRLDFNKAIIARAEELKLGIQLSPLQESNLRELKEGGCEILVLAGYGHRIGDWRPHLHYAINFHPSPLPEARGPYPTIQAILEKRESWGVSCHKVEPKLDSGDILAIERFPLTPLETHDSLDIKSQLAAGRLAEKVAASFSTLWNEAQPQGAGSYWKRLTDEQRTLDFNQPVESLLLHLRAFGSRESLAKIRGLSVHIRRAEGWTEAHQHTPGTVVFGASNNAMVIAVADGYLVLLEWSMVSPKTFASIGR